MAEAFGIAGSAFGTVSLGLQLYTEISGYLNSVEGRDEDLQRARKYAQLFQTSLNALRTWASNAGISNTDVDKAISQGQANCAVAINDLLRLVEELKGPDVEPDSQTSKFKALCKKLKYPFNKQNLEKLEKQLFDTVTVLHFTLNVLQLENVYVTLMSIVGMRQTLDTIVARLPEPGKSDLQDMRLHAGINTAETSLDNAPCSQDPKPNESVSRVESTGYQNGQWWAKNMCLCRKTSRRNRRQQWGPFIIETEMTFTDYHSPGCPFETYQPLKQQTKRVLKFPMPLSNTYWRAASQYSLFVTAGTGGISFGYNLMWVQTVDRSTSPSFQIVELALRHNRLLTKEDRNALLSSCRRRLGWSFANKKASISDVDRDGRSIVDMIITSPSSMELGKRFLTIGALEIFVLLAPFINAATHPDSITSSPILTVLCQSITSEDSTMAGEAITSLLSRCNDSAGQDCRFPYLYIIFHEQFNLIKSFSTISNYLEFGQLSKLILMEDHDMVRDYLERYPLSINEINYLGQTPIHIAVKTQNATILSILVKHADHNILNTQDNDGKYPIDHAANAVCHARRSGEEYNSEFCNGCHVLDILLSSESAIFTISVKQALEISLIGDIPKCIEGQKMIITYLSSRRQRLGMIAERELTSSDRHDLSIRHSGILDQNATQVQKYLETKGYHIPTYLKVYDSIETSNDSRSIYTMISSAEVAETALQSGFLMPMTLFDDIFLQLEKWIDSIYFDLGYHSFPYASYLCWLVDHGGDLRFVVEMPWGQTTAAHYAMAFLGMSARSYRHYYRVPLIPKVSSIIFDEENVDQCRCWCSPNGCTPLTKFLAVENWQHERILDIRDGSFLYMAALEHVQYLYELLSYVGYDIGITHWIDNAVVRYFTFSILGPRHTCCCLGNISGTKAFGPLLGDDREEIEEEDSSLLMLLQTLVIEFETQRGNYHEMMSFMKEYWAIKMETVHQELECSDLSSTERQSAEAVGVVWECYGPDRPPCNDNEEEDIYEEEEVETLENVLRELDRIAIDPINL